MRANLTAIFIKLDGTEVYRRESALMARRASGTAVFVGRRGTVAVFAECRYMPGHGSSGSKFTYTEVLADDRRLIQHKTITPWHEEVLSEVRRSVMVG